MEKIDAAPRYITTVGPNDVLLGRGAPIINNEGNVRFREIVAERKDEYKASCRHQLKNAIANDIIDDIVQIKKGRFLRMADDIEELKQKGHIPIDAKSAWVVADNIAILNKVKQALRELDDTLISTTSSTEKKRKNTNSSTATSSTMTSTSKRKRIEVKEKDIDVFVENNKDSNTEKPIKALDEEQESNITIFIEGELLSSQNYGDGYEVDTVNTNTSPKFELNQHHSSHNKQLETSHRMPPVSLKNHPSGRIVTNNEQEMQQSLRVDQPSILSSNIREEIMMQDHIDEARRIELRTQEQNLLHQIHIRQSELIHDVLQEEDQLNIPFPEQNQHTFILSKVVDERMTNKDIQSTHHSDYFQRRASLIPDQSHDMMTLKQHGTLDVNSLDSADQLFLRRQRLLYVQQEQQQKIMLLQYQLQQQEEQHQLLQLEDRKNAHRETIRNASSCHKGTDPMSNTTFLESELHLNNQHQQSHSYRNNALNELFETREINDLNQYQLKLQQQQYLASMFPSEYVPHSSSMQDMRSINERNDYTNIQQHSIQQDFMPIQFTNQMDLDSDRPYQNYPLYLSQLPDSSNDRIMTSSIEPNVTDLCHYRANIRSICTNTDDDRIDFDQIAAFKKFLERESVM